MKLHTFQELTTRIVNLSTRDRHPIHITFSGQMAYTNTKTLNIPTLPSGTILSPHQFSIWMGYVIHEAGHQTHTDLDLYGSACLQRKNPTFSYVLNLLEDIREENCDINKYPGDRKYLDSIHQFVDQKIPKQNAQNPDIMGLIYKQLYTKHRNLDTNIIRGNLDPETSKLISQIDFCNSTQDCIDLADKVVSYLKQKQEEQNQEESQSGNGEGEDNEKDNQTAPQTQQNEDSNSSNNEEDENEKSEPGNSSPGDGNPNGLGNASNNGNPSDEFGQGDSQGNPNQSPPSFIFSDQSISTWQEITEIKNILKQLKEIYENREIPLPNLEGKSIFPPENILNDKIYVPSEEDLLTYNLTRSQCTSQILALKKMFRIYLQAQTKKSTLRGLDEGKLDTQRLHIVSTGQTTIFKDSSFKFLPDTAIELMIDMSGSMNAEISRTTAIILSEALSSIPQIKLSISGFTTNHNYDRHQLYRDINANSGRQIGMDILQFKDFSEPYAKCKGKLGAIHSHGATPLGDAYGKSLEHIIPRQEPRKIIFLITDGQPSFTQGRNHSDYLLMKKIHTNAKKYHIQTLGFGIGKCEFLKDYFDQTIIIKNISSLPQDLLQALKLFI